MLSSSGNECILQEAPFCCSPHDPVIYNASSDTKRILRSPPPTRKTALSKMPSRSNLSSSVMRKVRSLDFTCLQKNKMDIPRNVASKFSSQTPSMMRRYVFIIFSPSLQHQQSGIDTLLRARGARESLSSTRLWSFGLICVWCLLHGTHRESLLMTDVMLLESHPLAVSQ